MVPFGRKKDEKGNGDGELIVSVYSYVLAIPPIQPIDTTITPTDP